jgi:hypothetical protein
MTDNSRSRSPDASVPPQLSNSKVRVDDQSHNQNPNRRNADRIALRKISNPTMARGTLD